MEFVACIDTTSCQLCISSTVYYPCIFFVSIYSDFDKLKNTTVYGLVEKSLKPFFLG